MNKVQNIWAELSKAKKAPQRTKLSAKKRNVKLSIIDELEDLYGQLEEATANASYFAYEMVPDMDDKVRDAIKGLDDMLLNSNMSDLRDIANEVKDRLAKFEEINKDLGLDMSDIYPDYDELKGWADNADDLAYDVAK